MLRKLDALAALLAIAAAAAACRQEVPPPIIVEDRTVRVHNQSGKRWSDVRVWLNDHFVAGTPVLEADARFTVQQRDFIAAMGQKFDPSRHHPYGVLVTARADDGEPVRLVWGQPYRR